MTNKTKNEETELMHLKGMNKETLIDHIKSNNNYYAFIFACQNEQLEVAKFLLEQGFVKEQMSKNGYHAFRYACKNNQLSTVKFLLSQGFVEEQVRSGVHDDFILKYVKPNLSVALDLLKQEDKVDEIKNCSDQAFYVTQENIVKEVVRFILMYGYDDGEWSYEPFVDSCKNGHLEVVKLLLEQGFVNEQIRALKKNEKNDFKIKYKDLVEKGIVNG